MTACGGSGDDLESQLASVDRFAERNRIGDSRDVFLVKHGFAGPSRVALIYGYANDFEACFDIAALYMAKYPGDTYTCDLAN